MRRGPQVASSPGRPASCARNVHGGEQDRAESILACAGVRGASPSVGQRLERGPPAPPWPQRPRGRRRRPRRRAAGPCGRRAGREGSRARRRRCPARGPPPSCLISSQLRSTSPACLGLDIAEDVRVAPDQLLAAVVGHMRRGRRLRAPPAAATGSGPGRGRRPARRAASRRRRVGGVGQLVGLLDRVRHDRALVLLAIPRALDPQPARELVEPRDRLAGSRAGSPPCRPRAGRAGPASAAPARRLGGPAALRLRRYGARRRRCAPFLGFGAFLHIVTT